MPGVSSHGCLLCICTWRSQPRPGSTGPKLNAPCPLCLPAPLVQIFLGNRKARSPGLICAATPRPTGGPPQNHGLCFLPGPHFRPASSSHLPLFRFPAAVLEALPGGPACFRLPPGFQKRRPDRATRLEDLSLPSVPSNCVLLSAEQGARDPRVLDFLPLPQPRHTLQPPCLLAVPHSCRPAPRSLSALHLPCPVARFSST